MYRLAFVFICGMFLSNTNAHSSIDYTERYAIIDEYEVDMAAWQKLKETPEMTAWLELQEERITELANMIAALDEIHDDAILPLLQALMLEDIDYYDVYIGFEDNTALMASGFPIEYEYHWWKATERNWYRLALTDKSRAHVADPYVDAATGWLCVSVVHAVIHSGELIGVVSADIFVPEQ